MNDEDFVDYCATHCRTERALFSGEHVLRLHRLADRPVPPTTPAGRTIGWTVMREDVVLPLVEAIREKQLRARIQARDEHLAAGFVEGALDAIP